MPIAVTDARNAPRRRRSASTRADDLVSGHHARVLRRRDRPRRGGDRCGTHRMPCTRTRTSPRTGLRDWRGVTRSEWARRRSAPGAATRPRPHLGRGPVIGRRRALDGPPAVGELHDRLGEQLDEVDRREHVVAHHRLDLGDLVGDGLVAVAVALEDAARHARPGADRGSARAAASGRSPGCP